MELANIWDQYIEYCKTEVIDFINKEKFIDVILNAISSVITINIESITKSCVYNVSNDTDLKVYPSKQGIYLSFTNHIQKEKKDKESISDSYNSTTLF